MSWPSVSYPAPTAARLGARSRPRAGFRYALAVRYTKAHGGGTIGVESQSTAAEAIISSDANVAGLGGFSGRESAVSVAWLAHELRSGHLRWILTDGTGGPQQAGDTRSGSQSALSAVAKVCRAVTLSSSSGLRSSYMTAKDARQRCFRPPRASNLGRLCCQAPGIRESWLAHSKLP